jgi:hypothetical protein
MPSGITLYDLEKVIFQHYQQMNRNKTENNSSREGKVLLSAFQGMCYRGRKTGHRAKHCSRKVENNKGKLNLQCNNVENWVILTTTIGSRRERKIKDP